MHLPPILLEVLIQYVRSVVAASHRSATPAEVQASEDLLRQVFKDHSPNATQETPSEKPNG
jgi:hypothetical protein